MSSCDTSELLKYLRTKNKLTIQDIADYLGVSKVAVCKWEKGDDIKFEHLYSLAQLYGVSFSELYYGELNDTSTSNYLNKDYNLNRFKFDEINDKTIAKIKSFYECYSNIYKRFFTLLPKFLSKKLNNEEVKEYNELKEYYNYDNKYVDWLINNQKIVLDEKYYDVLGNLNIEKIIIDYIKGFSNISKDELIWELSKFYIFNKNLRIQEIIESSNVEAVDCMFQFIRQQDKDYIFNKYLCYEDDSDDSFFSDILLSYSESVKIKHYGLYNGEEQIVKKMLNNKAHCYNDILFIYNGYELNDRNRIHKLDNNSFKKVLGEKTLDIKNTEAGRVLEIKYDLFNDKDFWKYFSLDEYNKIIDMNKTRYYKDIFRLKNKDPLLYFINDIHGKY